jgi:site-specific DNA recombinase
MRGFTSAPGAHEPGKKGAETGRQSSVPDSSMRISGEGRKAKIANGGGIIESATTESSGRPLGPRVVERPREEWIAVTIPALIRRETRERTRARREPNRQFSTRRLKEERWFLRRLLRCGVCGQKHACVTAKGAGGKKRADYRWSSNSGYRAENPPCRPTYVDAASLDELAFEQVRRHLLVPRLLVKAHRDLAVPDPDAIGALAGPIGGARRRLASTEGESQGLLDAWRAGFLGKMEFTDRDARRH